MLIDLPIRPESTLTHLFTIERIAAIGGFTWTPVSIFAIEPVVETAFRFSTITQGGKPLFLRYPPKLGE